MADKLKSVTTPTKVTTPTTSPLTADQLRAKLKAKMGQLQQMGVAVQSTPEISEPTQVWECLSCCDPVKPDVFLCDDCKDGTKKW